MGPIILVIFDHDGMKRAISLNAATADLPLPRKNVLTLPVAGYSISHLNSTFKWRMLELLVIASR